MINLVTLTPREREVWDAAYLSGYCTGHEAGWKAADGHAAAFHAKAYRIVQKVATYPTHEEIQRIRHESLRGKT